MAESLLHAWLQCCEDWLLAQTLNFAHTWFGCHLCMKLFRSFSQKHICKLEWIENAASYLNPSKEFDLIRSMNPPPFPREHHLLILASESSILQCTNNLYGFSNRHSVLSTAQTTKDRKVWSYFKSTQASNLHRVYLF